MPSGSKDRHPVVTEAGVARHDREALDLGLGDEHPIERVAMMRWERSGRERVRDRDR
jgi:hypothetical protein